MASPDENQQRRTVPKFGSFKPKTAIATEEEPKEPPKTASREKEGEQRGDKKRRGHRADHKRSGHHHSRSQHERRRSRSPDTGTKKLPAGEEEPQAAKTPVGGDLFFVDKKGDPLILRYGTNDRSRVPGYRRFGKGKLMGAMHRFDVHRSGSKEEWSLREYRDVGSVFRDKHFLAKLARVKSRRIKRKSEDVLKGDEDFIELAPSKKRKRGEEESDSPHNDQPNYRSIHGKSKPEDFDDSDFESDSDSSQAAVGDSEVSTVRMRSIHISRQVRDDPGAIDAWIKLIELQDDLLQEDKAGDTAKTQDEAKALADIKASLFEKALPHAKSSADRERLLVGLMGEGRRAWDSKALRKRWQEVSDSESGSFALWKARLDYELTNMLTFSYEDVRTYFTKKLQVLREQLPEASDDRLASASHQIIYLFLRLTRFLQDSGFSELAVAAWQALLEMTYFRPVTIQDSGSAKLSFSEFWESELPRIGEDGAQGWRQFATAESIPDPPDPRDSKPLENPETRDLYKAWSAVENGRARESRLPARTLDEGTEDDPYRVVMLSDIEDFLIWFPGSVLIHITSRLQDAFLLFCGLPAAFAIDETVVPPLDSPFTAARSKAFEMELTSTPETTQVSVDLSPRHPSFTASGSRVALSPEVLFAGNNWFHFLPGWTDIFSEDDPQVDAAWVIAVFRQLVRLCRMEQLAEYYLALEWVNEPNGVRKAAKALLKQYPSNTRLYNAYALIEWANQKFDISSKVLHSATSQNLGPDSSDKQVLWNTWTWMELENGKLQLALARLCQSVEDQPNEHAEVTPALLLKARSHFSSIRDFCLAGGQLEKSLEHAESMALLMYLTADGATGEAFSSGQGNISAALLSIDDLSQELTTRSLGHSSHHERLLQAAARLLYYHANHGPFRPVYLRERLQGFIHLFPQNTLFLRLFAWAESSLRIDDPVRELLQTAALIASYDCVSSRLFAIQHEAKTGTTHSCRAAFEAALDSEACRGNVQLWIYYIRFCYARPGLRGKAKDVFHRAVAACPWSKEVYMESFGTLVKEMGSSELRAVFNTITGKGLRVHVDLEEFAGKWKERQKSTRPK